MHRTHTGMVLLFAAQAMACGDSASSAVPLAPSVTVPAPPSFAEGLLVFADRDGFRTSEVRDRDEQVVQFTTAGELLWIADGTRFPGYRAAPGFTPGGYVFAPDACAHCAYEIRFGASGGERRAYLTLDRGENNDGTIVDLEVVQGQLRTTPTEMGPPGTFTLSGQVVEMTSAGPTAVPFARIRTSRYNWHGAAADDAGRYRLPWLDAGVYSIIVEKEGYAVQTRPMTIDGDVRVDFSLVRR